MVVGQHRLLGRGAVSRASIHRGQLCFGFGLYVDDWPTGVSLLHLLHDSRFLLLAMLLDRIGVLGGHSGNLLVEYRSQLFPLYRQSRVLFGWEFYLGRGGVSMLSLMLEASLVPEYLCSFHIVLALVQIVNRVVSVHWIAATRDVLVVNLCNLNTARLLPPLVINLASRSLHWRSLWSNF